MYSLQPKYQLYNDKKYIDHAVTDTENNESYRFVGDRISSIGIINFGAIKGNSSKRIVLREQGIKSDIMLVSLFPFTTNGVRDETTLRLYQGNVKIAEWLFKDTEVPFRFPIGAVVNQNISIEVKPKHDTSALYLCWQPVHVLSYIEI